MEYTITRGVCGQEGCRERRYYLDNGLWFCRRGHQQEVHPYRILVPTTAIENYWMLIDHLTLCRVDKSKKIRRIMERRAGRTAWRKMWSRKARRVRTFFFISDQQCTNFWIAYRGQRAYSLFLQIYQLILWKQCHALVHDRGFPAQFEVCHQEHNRKLLSKIETNRLAECHSRFMGSSSGRLF